jgi:nitroimidazol reductase NimA-like FMN-containing flavoprotein (pyridoxamine 5'-phosphate oxidase superfamily)
MVIHELSHDECVAVLEQAAVGHLACAHQAQPYIVPIQFTFDAAQHCAYAFSTEGQKITWMRMNPKVCLQVEEIIDKDRWTTVVALGRFEEIGHGPEMADARHHAERLVARREEWWLPAIATGPGDENQGAVVFRIAIDTMTGRRTARDRG